MTKPRIMHDPDFHLNKIYMLDFYKTVVVTHVEEEIDINNYKIYFRIIGESKMDWVRYKWFNQVYQDVKND